MTLRRRLRLLAAGGAVTTLLVVPVVSSPAQAVTCTINDPTVAPTVGATRIGDIGSGSTTLVAEPGTSLATPTLLCMTPIGPVDP